MNDITDEDLVRLYRVGQVRAFEELVARYLPRLIDEGVRARADAEELAQVTLIRVQKGLTREASVNCVQSYVFNIFNNELSRQRRDARRRNNNCGCAFSDVDGDDDYSQTIADALSGDSADQSELSDWINRYLDSLPGIKGVIYRAVVVDGLTVREAESTFAIGKSSVNRLVAEVSQDIKRRIDEDRLEIEPADNVLFTLRQIVAAMPEFARQVTHLVAYEGRNPVEVAESFGLSEDDVVSIVNSAIQTTIESLEGVA
jgi:RNA polymerase sigma factor (sigma-70 family)